MSISNALNSCRTSFDHTGDTAFPLPVGTPIVTSLVNSSCNSTTNNRVIAVYIDYNNNGVFTDPGEQVVLSASMAPGTYTPGFTVPTTVAAGTYARMRVIVDETSDPSTVTPCGTYATGETEEFRVLFTNPPNDVGVKSLEYPTLTVAPVIRSWCPSASIIMAPYPKARAYP